MGFNRGIVGLTVMATAILGIDTYVVAASRSHVVTVDDAVDSFRSGSQHGHAPEQGPRTGMVAAPSAPASEEPDGNAGGSEGAALDTTEEAQSATAQMPPGRSEQPPPTVARTPIGPDDTATATATEVPQTGWRLPAEGVYVYASSGYESVNVAGGHREMPDETAVTIRKTATGFSSRVQPYDEHVDLFEFSYDDDAFRMDRWYIERTFLGQTSAQDYDCSGSGPTHIRGATVGSTSNLLCTWEDRSRTEGTSTLKAYVDLALGDGTVVPDVAHIVVDNTTTGEVTGRAHVELWLHPATGQVLHEVRDIESDTPSALGRVNYREETRFLIESLTPRT